MRKIAILIVGLLVLLLTLSFRYVQSAPTGDASVVQRADVVWHAQSGSGAVDGARAQLVRNGSGATFTLHATELNPGHVYTTWFVAINNPAACSATPCTPADIIQNAASDSDVVYGAGHVVGQSGRSTFSGHLAAGDWSNGWLGNGFSNPKGAEIHLVLNDHGPAIAEQLSDMIHSYRGGCTDESLPAIFPPTAFADGIPGPNTCRLYQVAVFTP